MDAMTHILRHANLLAFCALAAASQAVTLTDAFAVDQTGLTLGSPGTATSTGTSLGGGLTRFLINTQTQNIAPGTPGSDSSVSVSGGAFNFSNAPSVTSNYAIDYVYASAVDFTGLTGFQVDFLKNDRPYAIFIDLTDSSGGVSTFASSVQAGSSFSVFASSLGGSADLTSIVRVSLQSDATLAGTDSSILRVQSLGPVASVPGPAAMAPFALGALRLRRRRKA
jgi:hypothetical protein